ncbi:FAD-dependent oxidoreductase [Thiothrix subterranea]|uniref:flavin monoamine oxidase family protein n=1 Tax=Thiothrix subterranea TaxID=2735563 RepID=UPI00192B79ED|nr:NAD(P)/FAD-dependent oxidoreductase [Thiothrix subterranea]QQZ29959.1 FAD-dependent oxidoreductase [Thiothrix subterranea]
MSRRKFLHLIAGLLASSTIAPLSATPAKRIVVVGAGIAGLTAAQTLRQQGHSVTVVEARDRLGGRLWTSKRWQHMPVDLGATWIHGAKDNPLSALADRIGAKRLITRYANTTTYNTAGKPLNNSENRQLEQWQARIDSALDAAQAADTDQSVQAAVETALGWNSLKASERQLVQFILNSTLEQEYAGSIHELSAYWHDAAAAFKGDDALFPDGYQIIVDHLAKGLNVQLQHVVKTVTWSEQQVTVQTNRGAFQADHAVITLPLGVLKSRQIAFSPPLPARKQQAINTLGMGTLNKCYLQFPNVFWPEDQDWLEYIPTEAGAWAEWVSLTRVAGWPVLLGFNAAKRGKRIEQWTDKQIVADAMQTLRKLFGANIPEPLDYQITRWNTDPYAQGAYSFNSVGSTPAMRDHLAERLGNTLFFAGEATERKHFSSVHGAYLSGLRAAQQILEQGRGKPSA